MEGDCLMARAGFLNGAEDVFLLDFRTPAVFAADVGPAKSIFKSIGDVVSEVSELRTAP